MLLVSVNIIYCYSSTGLYIYEEKKNQWCRLMSLKLYEHLAVCPLSLLCCRNRIEGKVIDAAIKRKKKKSSPMWKPKMTKH